MANIIVIKYVSDKDSREVPKLTVKMRIRANLKHSYLFETTMKKHGVANKLHRSSITSRSEETREMQR